MSKKIKQFRYYSETDSKNYPETSSSGTLAGQYENGNVFKGVFPISQLGIQALPGTKFYLNGNIHYITIGSSGIYDLDIKNGARVTELRFSSDSMSRIANSDSGYLIVDVLYGEED